MPIPVLKEIDMTAIALDIQKDHSPDRALLLEAQHACVEIDVETRSSTITLLSEISLPAEVAYKQ